jgi:hypothetical protein
MTSRRCRIGYDRNYDCRPIHAEENPRDPQAVILTEETMNRRNRANSALLSFRTFTGTLDVLTNTVLEARELGLIVP